MNSLTVKLASLAVHAEEYLSPIGEAVDKAAILGLLSDPEVRAFLDDRKNAVLLPVRRQPTRSQMRRISAKRYPMIPLQQV